MGVIKPDSAIYERLETESILNVPNDTGQLDRRFFFGGRYTF